MKRFFALMMMATCAACGLMPANPANGFPRIYVRQVVDATGALHDTLCISWVGDPSQKTFLVVKNSGIVNMGDHGEPLPEIYRHVRWSGRYDCNTKVLEILDNGERYVLVSSGNELTNGALSYHRIR